MAQKTALQPYALPGRIRTFVAKSESAPSLRTDYLNIISSTIVEPDHIFDSADNLLVKGDIEAQGASYFESISVGPDSPSGGFSGSGDIYASSGIKAMEGLYSEATAYGAGLEVADNSQVTVYTNVLTPTATLTAATQTIYDPQGDFGGDDAVEVGQYLKVISATVRSTPGQYVGATGEIIAVTDSTHLVISFGTAGDSTIEDATAMRFVIYPEPRLFVGDNGDVHYCIGPHEDASFKVCTDISNNEHAVHFVSKAGADGNAAVEIEFDPDIYSDCSALEVDYDATGFDHIDDVGTILDVIIDSAGATNGDIHAIDVAVSDPTNTNIEVEALVCHQGVDPIAQYLGDPAVLAMGLVLVDATTTYTDRTTEFNSAASDVQIFVADGDAILLASATKWDEINVLNAITASHSITPVFEFVKADGSWVVFSPADDTDGFSNNGTIRFEQAQLVDWGQRTATEVSGGDVTDGTDYYWIKITRTRKILPTPPTEDTIRVTALGARHGWDSVGRLAIKTYSQSAEPDTDDLPAGNFCFWIDTDDSKLYICYNHSGEIKTTEMT